ncbi:B12-binding domain-containing radical SAM protein [Patescibacteria group bacterium]
MRIVLVNPKPKIWIKAAIAPMGLAYLAANLEKNGFEKIKLVDYTVEPKASLPKADLVGITAATPLIKSAWKVAKLAKKKGALTVLGGPHVSVMPSESISLPFIDFVVVGEGEETMLELCQALEKGKQDFSKIKGLVYKKGKKVIHNSPRPFVKDLDSLPFPAYHYFKLPLYTSTQPHISVNKPAVGIMTARGCPFGCNFCYKGTFGRVWRPRSVENVLAEWEYLVKQVKVKEIALMDDGFNLDVERAIKICREIKKRGLVIPWRAHNGIRADRTPVRLLKAMKESGCYMACFGVESGCQKVVDAIGKKLSLKDVITAIQKCRKLGILTMAFFMIGNPEETKAEIMKTIDFSLKLDSDLALFSVVTPFPGTRIFKKLKSEGKIKTFNWDDYSAFGDKGFFDYNDVRGEEAVRLARLAYRKFYLRPKVIMRILRRKETWLNLPSVMVGSAHYLLQRDL